MFSLVIFLLQVSPQIIEPPKSQSVTEGYPVNLSCVASGIPTPTLVWTFNNGDLPSGINQTDHEEESFLVLPSVTIYKCTAKNKANTTSSSATLRVYGKFSCNDIGDDDDDDDDDEDDDDDVNNDDDDDNDEKEK